MGGGGGGSAPKAGPEERALFAEQGEIAIQQRVLLEDQARTQDLLAPILFNEIGFDVTQGDPNNPEIGRLETSIEESQAILDLPKKERPKGFRGQREERDLIAKIRREKDSLAKIKGITGLTKRDDPFAELRATFEQEFLNQASAGLAGGTPANPGLIKDLNREQLAIEERLRKRFGDRFAETTAGIQAQQRFEQSRDILFDQSREQDIAQGLSLFNQSRNTTNAINDATINRAIALSQGQLPTAQGFGQAAASLTGGLNQLASLNRAQSQVAGGSTFGAAAGNLTGLAINSLSRQGSGGFLDGLGGILTSGGGGGGGGGGVNFGSSGNSFDGVDFG